MPSFDQPLLPMQPALLEAPFDSPRHLFELKWGGVRALLFIDRSRLRVQSQAGRDITSWFPELAGIVGQVRASNAVIDGEVVALAPNGDPDLTLLSERLTTGVPRAAEPLCIFQAYDLLAWKDASLLKIPLQQRKQALGESLPRSGPAVVADPVESEGVAYFAAVAKRRLPGIVAKDRNSLYYPGERTNAWQEIRVFETGWFVIGGYVLGAPGEPAVASLLLGEPGPSGLHFVGQVRGNLPSKLIEPVVAASIGRNSPFSAAPAVARLIYWLRPELVCEVKYAGREPDRSLRFPIYVTLRPDLSPDDCLPASGGQPNSTLRAGPNP
jgi:bifunctional non-homologous end joining protein LigD